VAVGGEGGREGGGQRERERTKNRTLSTSLGSSTGTSVTYILKCIHYPDVTNSNKALIKTAYSSVWRTPNHRKPPLGGRVSGMPKGFEMEW
jgi:hypothetical protein